MNRRSLLLCLLALSMFLFPARPAGVELDGMQVYDADEYDAHRQNWSIVRDDRDIMYFANTAGVLEFDATAWRLIELPNNGSAFALAKGKDGRIFVGGHGEIGLLDADELGTISYVSLLDEVDSAHRAFDEAVVSIQVGEHEIAYLTDRLLLVRRNGSGIDVIEAEDHFLSASYHDGSLYVLDSLRGLMRVGDSGSLTQIEGGQDLRSLTMVSWGGKLVLPTLAEGLITFENGSEARFSRLAKQDTAVFRDQEISSATVLDQRFLALGTSRNGLFLIDPEGEIQLRVGTADGLPDQHVYGIGSGGEVDLWIGLDDGLALLDLEIAGDETEPDMPFRAMVRLVEGTKDEQLIFGGAFQAGPGLVPQLTQDKHQRPTLAYDYNAFRFTFSANGYIGKDSLSFQTYIEGIDQDWSPWSNRPWRELTNLHKQRYSFRVRARNAQGEISQEGTFAFRVLGPWHESWWFALIQIAFIFFLFFISGIVRRSGHGEGFQDGLLTFAILVPFGYLSAAIAPFIGFYSQGIAFFGVLMKAVVGFLLSPIKRRLKKLLKSKDKKGKEDLSPSVDSPLAAIAAARENDSLFAVMFFDLGGIIAATDKGEKGAGDRLSDEISQRLSSTIREGDTVARTDIDELIVVLSTISSKSDGEMVADKLREALTLPFRLDSRELSVAAKIGIAFYPDDGSNPADLTSRARETAI